ncbi:restriction endonuclease subunit S [Actinomadura gamaensis]|uniref:Restriction endonuclease subunit S n=1 Tax=Actinomadura gamaensis TaxID=1763541 RepID=A0ABV9U4N1_9ACTN
MTDLPSGWVETTLGDIAETSLGKMLDRGKGNGGQVVPYLRNVNVQWGRIDLDDVRTMEIPGDELAFFRLEPGDLLVCEGGEVGRCAIWPGTGEYMAYQKALHRIRPHAGVEAKYLCYLLEYMSISKMFAPYTTGSTIKHLPQQQLRRLPIKLPPTAEQRRIVAVLEDHLSRLAASTVTIRESMKRAKNLKLRLLDDYVTDIEKKWKRVALGHVAEVQSGIQKQPRRRPVDNSYPFLRVANVYRGELDLSDVHQVELFEGEIDRYRLRAGDLLVVEGNGSPTQIGRAAIWRDDIPNCVHQNHLIRVRPGLELDPSYLEFVWNTPKTAREVRSVASSTSGLFTLSAAKVKSISIPVPPRSVQELLVAEVQRWWACLDDAERSLEGGYRKAGSLRRSLLAEAFAGRLVGQNPSDEPASILLDRIRSEWATQRPIRRARRGKDGKTPQKETLV